MFVGILGHLFKIAIIVFENTWISWHVRFQLSLVAVSISVLRKTSKSSYRILALLWNLGHFRQPFYIFTESFSRFYWSHKKGRLFIEQKTCLASPQIVCPYKNWTIFCNRTVWTHLKDPMFCQLQSLHLCLTEVFPGLTQQWHIHGYEYHGCKKNMNYEICRYCLERK